MESPMEPRSPPPEDLHLYGSSPVGPLSPPLFPAHFRPLVVSSPSLPVPRVAGGGPLRSVAVRAARLWGGYRAAVGRLWGGSGAALSPPRCTRCTSRPTPPTGLEFCLYCHFFGTAERNLVVAGTSQLYVYRLNHDAESGTKGDRNVEGRGHKEKLELVASFSFFGNVMSMASVQLAGAKRDALLLSFKDAKLSVVEYDPGTHDLKTLSLHYFEEPELRDGFVQNVHIPKVRVDPDGRCAVMLIYGTRLVVLPFRRDSLADEHEGLVGEG
ncbi:cleavage and polyadenylation specificity factor subunit 1-like isoform X2 [Gallus gallus]|uniref:cleavage and polyadenylation specificity factor subunit 1-like isoform X2 n=1 Tax=Gallus gallus TaxID=9031 RepID=UPI001AE8B7DE|nr:cleavage and polyadenylation specificity factor subunit 1-like isoform X2 [Gallus gallus]